MEMQSCQTHTMQENRRHKTLMRKASKLAVSELLEIAALKGLDTARAPIITAVGTGLHGDAAPEEAGTDEAEEAADAGHGDEMDEVFPEDGNSAENTADGDELGSSGSGSGAAASEAEH